jgi:hypothetical protein
MGRTVDEEVLKDTVRPDQQIRSASEREHYKVLIRSATALCFKIYNFAHELFYS